MLDLLNNYFFRLHLFLFGKKCPNCNERKFLGTGFCRSEEGKMVFGKICFSCFACYKAVNGQMSFQEFFKKEDFEENR